MKTTSLTETLWYPKTGQARKIGAKFTWGLFAHHAMGPCGEVFYFPHYLLNTLEVLLTVTAGNTIGRYAEQYVEVDPT